MNLKKYFIIFGVLAAILPFTGLNAVSLFSKSDVKENVASEGNLANCNIFATMSIQKVNEKTLVFQDVKKQMEKRASEMREKFEKLQTELRKEAEGLSKNQKVMSPEKFNSDMQELQQRGQKEQDGLNTERQNLEKSYFNAISVINEKIMSVVNKYATDHNICAIYEKSQLVYSKFKDVSDDLIPLIDKDIKEHKIDFSNKANASSGIDLNNEGK